MNFNDFIEGAFLQGFSGGDIGTSEIVLSLFFTCLISLYIFFAYRALTRKTFYSKNFNISLAAVSIISAGIILTIQSSLVVSLGMVGALSIVRFRTAVKDPMDLAFMFWAISVGIMCGGGMVEVALLCSLALTVVIMALELMPTSRIPLMLVVNAKDDDGVDSALEKTLNECCKYHRVKSRNISGNVQDIIFEVRTSDERTLAKRISQIDGVDSSCVMSHDGEVSI